MFCWGSWANTQKLASKSWGFPLFYWDYTIGLVLVSFIAGITLGSTGTDGQGFFENLGQVGTEAIMLALLGGIIFNLANLLIVAAIDIAGMAIAFPIGIGIALVLGVILNYVATPLGDPVLLFIGVGLVCVAIILDALAYKRISQETSPARGIIISLAGGILMGFFFRFVAASISTNFLNPTPGLMTPYSALFVFSIGVFISNFVFNSYFMYRPLKGEVVTYRDYLTKGSFTTHLIGMLGGGIWTIGMLFSLVASGVAGFAISYGLGQGATMVAAIWGVFVWREFRNAPKGTNLLLTLMFISFIAGLALIVYSRY
jgi:glucose uptake protein